MKAAIGAVVVLIGAGLILLLMRAPAEHTVLLGNATAAPVPGQPGVVDIFLQIENSGGPDRIIGASSAETTQAVLLSGGPVLALAIPAASSPSLASDGAYLRLAGIDSALDPGRLIPFALTFEKAGTITTRARLGEMGEHAMMAPMSPSHAAPDDGTPAPTLQISVTEDADGWRVQLETTDFTFSEDAADGPHIPGMGHGHLYLNGLKLQRLYGTSATIGALPPGTHDISVSLNTNDHRPYRSDGVPVAATVTVQTR